MKKITFITLLGFCNLTQAECNEAQERAEMAPEINYIRNNVFVGASHPNIDTIILTVPSGLEGLSLVKIVVSDGGILGIPSYKMPLAFNLENGFAKTAIEVDLKKIGDFTISFQYTSNECGKAFYKLISG
jgi:hypothetical protein